MSSDQNPGWLGYIGDSTNQLYRDYRPFIRVLIGQPVFHGTSRAPGFFFTAQVVLHRVGFPNAANEPKKIIYKLGSFFERIKGILATPPKLPPLRNKALLRAY